MKVRMLLDGGKPKVPPEQLRKTIEKSGMSVAEEGGDIGIVVGGDGRFGRYGRTESIPLLFVGVRSKGITGSRAYLAQSTIETLARDLSMIEAGAYRVEEMKRLRVLKNRENIGEVFTDVYLQRGSESSCIRYEIEVSGSGVDYNEAAIGDGVVVTTKAGSTGYYSYPDRIKGDQMDPFAHAELGENEVGICHVSPTFTEREGTAIHPLRYKVPWGTKIRLRLYRTADARLYGTTDSRGGVKIGLDDSIEVLPGRQATKVIVLGKGAGSRQRARRR